MMEVSMYIAQLNNLKESIYYKFIDLAFEICDTFYFVVRRNFSSTDENIDYSKDIYLNKLGKNIIQELNPYLVKVNEQLEWPSTTLGGDIPALVYYFRTDEGAKKILQKVSNSINNWIQPDRPEDLGFMYKDEVWFANCTHEEMFDVITKDFKHIDLLKKIDGLEINMYEI